MVLGQNSRTTAGAGVVFSVLLHLGVAWGFLAGGASSADALAFERPSAPPPDQKKVDLGDPDSRAISMSWLGFDEYRKHIAHEAPVDQPELTMDPAAPTSSPSVAQAELMVTQAAQAAATARREAERLIAEMAGGLRAFEALGGVLPRGEGVGAGREGVEVGAGQDEREARAEAAPGEKSRPDEREAQASEAPPTEAVMAEASPERAASEGATGQQDDRESDATSVEQTALKELGNPLSARGLRIRTVKPNFSHYTTIMSTPHDPIIRLHFGRDGRVRLVELLQSSGINDIDRPVLDAAYRWRAEGKSLEQLGSSESVSIDMRILL